MILKFSSYRTSKGRLLKQVKGMGEKEFARIINPIICEYRDMDIDDAKKERFLQSNEVKAFAYRIGEDAQETKLVVLDTLKTDKQILRSRIPHLSNPSFIRIMNGVIANNRKEELKNIRFKRYITAREIKTFLLQIGEEF